MATGRPQIEIKSDAFEKLCSLQCTLAEIASFFRCSEDTIERWCKRTYEAGFAECFKKYSAGGKISLRRAQFRLAEKSAAMAIFLGKNYLGQKDSAMGEDTAALDRLDAILKGLQEGAREGAENGASTQSEAE